MSGLTIHTTGNWKRGEVRVSVVPSTRRIVPDVEAAIDAAWRAGKDRLGERLFDGPMCRMESWRAAGDSLELQVSLTGYRIFFGTNLSNHELMYEFGKEVGANSVGVSSVVHTRDNWLLFGRRNSNVAYYPNRVHPFAGALEETDLSDIFGAVEREMQEELHLSSHDIASIRCVAMVEDHAILQPELIFHTRVNRTRSQVESQVHAEEHGGSVAIEATPAAIDRAIADPGDFTPVGLASLSLLRRAIT